MKPGYYFVVTSAGASSHEVKFNAGDWTRRVPDSRSTWSQYGLLDNGFAMTTIPQGLLIAVPGRLKGGRPDDNMTMWIFIDAKMKISGGELAGIVDRAGRLVGDKDGWDTIAEDTIAGDPLLVAERGTNSGSGQVLSSHKMAQPGRIELGDYTEREILDAPFMDAYAKFNMVLVYKNGASINNAAGTLKDATPAKIVKKISVLPPGDTPRDVKLRLNGEIFDKPMLINADRSNAVLSAEKKDRLPLENVFYVIDGDERPIRLLSGFEWRKRVGEDDFDIFDQDDKKKVKGAVVEVLNQSFDKEKKSLPEEELGKVRIKISAPDYNDVERTADLSKGRAQLFISQKERTYTYTTEGGRNKPITITVSGKGIKRDRPIKGYRLEEGYGSGKENRLVYDGQTGSGGSSGWMWTSIGLFAVLLYLCIAGGLGIWPFGEDAADVAENGAVTTAPQTAPTSPAAKSTGDIIAYMDANTVWNGDTLQSCKQFEGLYEDLNGFNVGELTGKWHRIINGEKVRSKNFEKIVEAATKYQKSQNRKSIPRLNPDPKTRTVDIEKYIQTLSEAVIEEEPELGLEPPAKDAEKVDPRESPKNASLR